MKYAVHLYPTVNVKVIGIEANSIAEAVTLAEGLVNLHDILDNTTPHDKNVEHVVWDEGPSNFYLIDSLDEKGELAEDGGQWFDCDLNPLVEGKTLIEQKAARADAASLFMSELLDSVESLTGISDEHGALALANLMYLQSAILKGTFIDHHSGESALMTLVGALPSAEKWMKFIQIEIPAQGDHGEDDAPIGPTLDLVSTDFDPEAAEPAMSGGNSAYQVTEEDVECVLRSNSLAVANTDGKSFSDLSNEILPTLDLDLIEQAALFGDDLDEQTDYANDEITRQLRELGILEPLAQTDDEEIGAFTGSVRIKRDSGHPWDGRNGFDRMEIAFASDEDRELGKAIAERKFWKPWMSGQASVTSPDGSLTPGMPAAVFYKPSGLNAPWEDEPENPHPGCVAGVVICSMPRQRQAG